MKTLNFEIKNLNRDKHLRNQLDIEIKKSLVQDYLKFTAVADFVCFPLQKLKQVAYFCL